MGAQTSRKVGVKSGTKKMQNSRHGFDTHPATAPVPGAFGEEDREKQGKGVDQPVGRTRNLDKATRKRIARQPAAKGAA